MINESLLLQTQLDICHEKYNCKKSSISNDVPVCSSDNRTFFK